MSLWALFASTEVTKSCFFWFRNNQFWLLNCYHLFSESAKVDCASVESPYRPFAESPCRPKGATSNNHLERETFNRKLLTHLQIKYSNIVITSTKTNWWPKVHTLWPEATSNWNAVTKRNTDLRLRSSWLKASPVLAAVGFSQGQLGDSKRHNKLGSLSMFVPYLAPKSKELMTFWVLLDWLNQVFLNILLRHKAIMMRTKSRKWWWL